METYVNTASLIRRDGNCDFCWDLASISKVAFFDCLTGYLSHLDGQHDTKVSSRNDARFACKLSLQGSQFCSWYQ